MKNKIYIILAVLLNGILALFVTYNAIHFPQNDNLIFLFMFSICFWFIGLVSVIFHNKKLFNWFYEKISPLADGAHMEYFADSQYVLPWDLARKRLKIATIVLLLISIIFQLILLII